MTNCIKTYIMEIVTGHEAIDGKTQSKNVIVTWDMAACNPDLMSKQPCEHQIHDITSVIY